jgi:microcystin-dependent protein
VSVPVGTIYIFSGNIIPSGYLFCDGELVSKTTYASLWTVIGHTYLGGKFNPPSSFFFIPDLRGLFIRGISINTTYGVTTGASLGTYQSQSVQKHSHKYDKVNSSIQVTSSSNLGAKSSVWDDSTFRTNTGSTIFDDNLFANTLTDETRPHNISMNYIIKF